MLDQEAEYMIVNKQYKEASDNYIRILRELPGNANLLFRIGYCFLNAGGYNDQAISYLEKASLHVASDVVVGSLREENAPPEAFLLLGVAYQRSNQFEEAEEAYIRFRELLPEGDERELIANQYLQSIDHAQNLMRRPLKVEKVNLGRGINSNAANVNAVVSGDGQTMAFTRITRNGFDVFVAGRQGDSWGRPVNISRQLRQEYLLTTDLSYNGSELFLVYYVPDGSDLYTSTFEGGEWGRARSIGRQINSRNNETHASVSADGTTLYFTSDRDGGFGGLDIYRAKLDNRGRWRDVVNMGQQINTPFNEETPFVTNDNRHLFFSSEGHNSMGGYDVFYVDLDDPAQVHNLGYPANSTGDDLFYFPVYDGQTGYISYHDQDGIGSRDIFRVSIGDEIAADAVREEEPEIVADYGEEEPEIAAVADQEEAQPDQALIDPGNRDESEVSEIHDIYDTALPSSLPLHTREGRSYSVQFLALQEDVGAGLADTLPGVYIHFDTDGFSRLLTGYYRTEEEAMQVLMLFREKGYPDAFIRINNYIPNYTVQVKAMSNYLARDYFSDLDEVICIKGADGLYRYSYGYYSDRDEAADEAERLRAAGYSDLFINRVDW